MLSEMNPASNSQLNQQASYLGQFLPCARCLLAELADLVRDSWFGNFGAQKAGWKESSDKRLDKGISFSDPADRGLCEGVSK